ncbi:MAG: TlpA family protein disulfide reductase [Gemmatimonadetes bacterium]|nr:TlpA family protein disulfide reductase [Gemmatimonadota bacterium]
MSVSIRAQWFTVGVIVLGLVSAVGIGIRVAPPAAGPGAPAPDFRAVRLATGDTVSLSSYRGDVVLVNIWATWCYPCEAEMPEIERLYQELGPEGLRVLAVSIDHEGPDVVRAWARERHLTFEILHDQSGEIQRLYQTIGVPESFVIDRNGQIVKRVTGYRVHWDDATQKGLFRRLLAQKADAAGE